MESSDEEGTCSSSGEISYRITETAPTHDDVEILLGQTRFMDSLPDFMSRFQQTRVIESDGLVLGLFSILSYEEARDSMNKKLVGAIDTILDNDKGTLLFFSARIGNTPVDAVFELYRAVELRDSRYIFVSQVDPQDSRSVEAAAQAFSEFDRRDLRLWPRRSEEVFLLRCGRRVFVECGGAKYNVYVLERSEFERFIADFGNEISK